MTSARNLPGVIQENVVSQHGQTWNNEDGEEEKEEEKKEEKKEEKDEEEEEQETEEEEEEKDVGLVIEELE